MDKKPRAFFVELNGKIIGVYKTLNGAVRRARRTDFNSCDDVLSLFDNNGDMYKPLTGDKKEYSF